MKICIVFITMALFTLLACSDPDEVIQGPQPCDQLAIVDEDRYLDSSAFVTIVAARIEEDCLIIEYSASGCSGDSWQVSLYDSGAIAESEPEQRYIRFDLVNPEACLAVFKKEVSFTLSPLRISNEGTILLNLQGFPDQLEYRY